MSSYYIWGIFELWALALFALAMRQNKQTNRYERNVIYTTYTPHKTLTYRQIDVYVIAVVFARRRTISI